MSFAEYLKEHLNANPKCSPVTWHRKQLSILHTGQDALRNAIDESLKKHLQNDDIKAMMRSTWRRPLPEEPLLS